MANKAIDKNYLLQTLKDFDAQILSPSYQKYTDFADDFDNTATYAVGDYVTYEGGIYRCINAHSAGDWIASDFTKIIISDEFKTFQNSGVPEEELRDTVGWTGKNLYSPKMSTKTKEGVTATYNGDGTYTLNSSSATASAFPFYLDGTYNDLLSLDDGEYILSGCPQTDSAVLIINCEVKSGHSGTNHQYEDTGSGCTIEINNEDYNNRIYIWVKSGVTLTNVVFKPMIRKASISDSTYEAYHDSVEEVIKQVYADNGVLGARNFIKLSDENIRTSVVNYTYINNGVKINNSSAALYQFISFWMKNLPKSKTIKISADVTITSGKGCIYVRDVNTSTIILERDITSNGHYDLTFNTRNYESLALNLYCTRDVSTMGDVEYSNIVVKLSTDTDTSYSPYAMTNKELTDNLASKISYADNSILGVKNLLPYPYNIVSPNTVNGVTFTANSDGSVILDTAGSSATGDADFTLCSMSSYFSTGKYILSLNNDDTNVEVLCYLGGTSGTLFSGTDNVFIDITSNTLITIILRVKSGAILDNYTVYPMIRVAGDADETYAPFALSNSQITKYLLTKSTTDYPYELSFFDILKPNRSYNNPGIATIYSKHYKNVNGTECKLFGDTSYTFTSGLSIRTDLTFHNYDPTLATPTYYKHPINYLIRLIHLNSSENIFIIPFNIDSLGGLPIQEAYTGQIWGLVYNPKNTSVTVANTKPWVISGYTLN